MASRIQTSPFYAIHPVIQLSVSHTFFHLTASSVFAIFRKFAHLGSRNPSYHSACPLGPPTTFSVTLSPRHVLVKSFRVRILRPHSPPHLFSLLPPPVVRTPPAMTFIVYSRRSKGRTQFDEFIRLKRFINVKSFDTLYSSLR